MFCHRRHCSCAPHRDPMVGKTLCVLYTVQQCTAEVGYNSDWCYCCRSRARARVRVGGTGFTFTFLRTIHAGIRFPFVRGLIAPGDTHGLWGGHLQTTICRSNGWCFFFLSHARVVYNVFEASTTQAAPAPAARGAAAAAVLTAPLEEQSGYQPPPRVQAPTVARDTFRPSSIRFQHAVCA